MSDHWSPLVTLAYAWPMPDLSRVRVAHRPGAAVLAKAWQDSAYALLMTNVSAGGHGPIWPHMAVIWPPWWELDNTVSWKHTMK